MKNIINKFKANRAAHRALLEKLDGLTDPHFFTIAQFARNVEFNTGKQPTTDEVTELRALLG